MVRTEKQSHNRSRRWRELTEHEVGRPHFRFRNPYQEGELEFLIQAEYDYFEIAIATPVVAQTAFTIQKGGSYTPTGGAAFFKQYYHTNLKQAGVLAAPKKHLTKGISISIRNDVYPTDLILWTYNTFCRFVVGDGDKSYFDGVAAEAPASGGVFGTILGSATQTTGVGAWCNGYPVTSNMLVLAIDDNDGVGIEQGQPLNFIMDPTQVQAGAFTTIAGSTAGGTGIKGHVRLQGIEARGVQ
jgi:hypothetical protein